MEEAVKVEDAVKVVNEPSMEEVAAGTVVAPEIEGKVEVKAVEGAQEVQKEEASEVDASGKPNTDAKPEKIEQDKIQERINKIVAKEGQKVREAQMKIQELEAKLNAQPTIKEEPAKIPSLEDFDYDDEKHQEAVIQYEVRKQLDVAQQITNQQQAEQDKHKIVNEFTNKEAEYISTHPEYAEEINNLPSFNDTTLSAIYELGPQVSHYLAKHLDIANDVANASPTMAAVKLGQISMGLSADKKVVKPSTAPEPVKTLAGAGTVSKSLEDLSMDEIMSLP